MVVVQGCVTIGELCEHHPMRMIHKMIIWCAANHQPLSSWTWDNRLLTYSPTCSACVWFCWLLYFVQQPVLWQYLVLALGGPSTFGTNLSIDKNGLSVIMHKYNEPKKEFHFDSRTDRTLKCVYAVCVQTKLFSKLFCVPQQQGLASTKLIEQEVSCGIGGQATFGIFVSVCKL